MSNSWFETIKKGLIVSCQALENEPLFGANTMAQMAKAAEMGGAVAIRANSTVDIKAIKKAVHLPVIGLIKRDYEDSDVFITPTRRELQELIDVGADMIALDGTRRPRPNGESLEEQIAFLKGQGQMVMADISTLDEALYAESLGVNCVSTTLSGYTPYSPQQAEPDFMLLQQAAEQLSIPVIAEGKISTPTDARKMLELSAYAVVVGSAITRPQLITKMYVNHIKKG